MKITNIEPYDSYGKPVYHRYLEFVGPNYENQSLKSNKFWEVAVFADGTKYVVATRWGKFGAKGQTKTKVCWGQWTAEESALTQAQKKRDKGYGHEIDVITRLGATLDGGG